MDVEQDASGVAPELQALARLHTWYGWQRVTLATDENGQDMPWMIFEDSTGGGLWDASALLRNQIRRLQATTFRLAEYRSLEFRGVPHSDDFEALLRRMLAIARDTEAIHGRIAAEALRDAVEVVQSCRLWVTCFRKIPRDPRRLLELRWQAEVWAADQVRRVFQKFVPAPSRDAWAEKMLNAATQEAQVRGYPTVDIAAAVKKADHLIRRRLLPQAADTLIVEMLIEAVSGPFDQAGRLQNQTAGADGSR